MQESASAQTARSTGRQWPLQRPAAGQQRPPPAPRVLRTMAISYAPGSPPPAPKPDTEPTRVLPPRALQPAEASRSVLPDWPPDDGCAGRMRDDRGRDPQPGQREPPPALALSERRGRRRLVIEQFAGRRPSVPVIHLARCRQRGRPTVVSPHGRTIIRAAPSVIAGASVGRADRRVRARVSTDTFA